MHRPDILAPAGDQLAFLAALAAGADAIYVGLKHFSARMQSSNFSIKELARLTELADRHECKVYVALNSLLKPDELDAAGRLLVRLARAVRPAGIIVQDLGALELARQAGYAGELHLSTLAAVTHPAGLAEAKRLGAARVVLPREHNLDEIKAMAAACPPGLDLEVFVHGALCFCVSGRCYWSSYLGGKSGLRGRCVQPCRRTYAQKSFRQRFFSCTDLSLDVLAKTLLDVERVRAWKIEGRKKGPHYVYYTTTAYRMIRDAPDDPSARKEAMAILERALGRTATHAIFLPQRPVLPVPGPGAPEVETSSGMLAGRVAATPDRHFFIKPRLPLLPGDMLRVGHEDEPWHQTVPVRRGVPKSGRFDLRAGRGQAPKPGTPVFLVDRREPELRKRLSALEAEFAAVPPVPQALQAVVFAPTLPVAYTSRPGRPQHMTVLRSLPHGKVDHPGDSLGLWLCPATFKAVSRTLYSRIVWWLPPMLWPDEEPAYRELVRRLAERGARHFVCNAPWQVGLFDRTGALQLIAGPFCNSANVLALAALQRLGFCAAIVSPELGRDDLLGLPARSPLPLGLVVQGAWPVGLSRYKDIAPRTGQPISSPKNELFYTRSYGANLWIYAGWPLDLGEQERELEQAGYTLFITLEEPRPEGFPAPRRSSLFNWEQNLL